MKHLPIRVSDHAVLRYLERVGGFEIEALRAQIAARVGRSAIAGVCALRIDGHQFVIKQTDRELVVITVLETGNRMLERPEGMS